MKSFFYPCFSKLTLSILSKTILLGGVLTAVWCTFVQAQTVPDVVISETSEVSGIALTANQLYQINEDVTYTVAGGISGNYALTKIGLGTLKLTTAGHSASLVVGEGLATVSGTNSTARFGNGLTVHSGATVQLLSKDTLGYNRTATNANLKIYLYGGTLEKNTENGENETLGYVDIYMRGGKITATNGFYDLLRPESRFYAQAEDTATADAPTESVISARLNMRTNYFSTTEAPTFDVVENALLTVSGTIIGGQATDLNLIKTGAGTLALTNAGNSYAGMTKISEGILKLSGSGKFGSSASVTVDSGATFEMATSTIIPNPITFSGTGSQNAGAIHFSANGTLSGAGTLADDASISVDDGVKGTVSGTLTGSATLTKTGSGTLEFTTRNPNILDELIINEGSVLLSNASGTGGTGAFNGIITVNSGASLLLNQTDALGYYAGNPSMINVNGGIVASNEDVHYSLGNFTLTNGTISDGGHKNSSSLFMYSDGTITVKPGTSYLTASAGRIQYRGQNIDAQTGLYEGGILNVEEGGSLIVDASFRSSSSSDTAYALQKIGPGTMVFSSVKVSSGEFYIKEGTVKIPTIGNSHVWNGNVYVSEGATLETLWDGLGYGESTLMTIHLEGTLKSTGLKSDGTNAGNDTLRHINLNYRGGTSTGCRLDILGTDVNFHSLAKAGATADDPTVSTIANNLAFRTNVAGKNSMVITTDANTVLKMTGRIYPESATMNKTGFHKAGDGTLVISNATNSLELFDIFVDEGTLQVLNNALSSASSLTVAKGACLLMDSSSMKISALNVSGSLNLKVLDAETSNASTINGEVTFTEGALFTVSSEGPVDFGTNDSITLMMSDQEFAGIDTISLDTSNLQISLPTSMFWEVSQSELNGIHYLNASFGVPEPSTMVLLLSGLSILGAFSLRNRTVAVPGK